MHKTWQGSLCCETHTIHVFVHFWEYATKIVKALLSSVKIVVQCLQFMMVKLRHPCGGWGMVIHVAGKKVTQCMSTLSAIRR
jgi:hypothetical protein